MSRSNNSFITLMLRKVSTGAKVCAMQLEDLNHAYSVARVLVRSPEYCRCYAVATDWQNEPLFTVQPDQVAQAPAPYQAPAPPQPYAQQYQPALPPYAPRPAYAQPQAIDAEFESDFQQLPGYPRLPGGR